MSLFGQPAGGNSFFGTPTTQQPASTGIFGSTAAQPATGGGLFGQPAQPATGGGLFGQQPQQQQPQTGMFGQPAQQQQSTGLFGQPTAQPATGGGLFGQQPQQQQQTGMFGQPAQQQQSTGLFGQPAQQQQTGTGLFGQTTTTSGGGLFGQQQQQPQQQTGLFGQPAQQPQQQTGLFGSTFGQQPQQQTGLFGQPAQQQQPQQQIGAFGAFGGLGSASMMQQPQQVNAVIEKIAKVNNSWDANHPDYAFRYYFYNSIGKERASQYQKPPGDDNDAWEKAWAERPNDGCVPVRANGFKDLDLRVKSQEKQVLLFRTELHNIQEKLNAIQSRHDLTTSIKLEDCRRRHVALARRALSLAAKVQVLKNRGYALQPEEEMLKKRLEGLAKLVQDPAAAGRMNEIWARMMVVQEKARAMEESMGKVEIVWDENQLQTAGRLLQSNFDGLGYLTKEVLAIEKSFAEWEELHKTRNGGL
ncbi:nucleoporin complex subunit 54-domain-containing protein [Pyronema domesticum]|uniref:Similar to Nucleoporin nup44 acc. no. O42963 n=1 Tax=Pyronema omphalodes (strain CBS 100304) TaxID=1076935 RepID=U4L2F2_PYROM|nr:nucleoporin complex subunit 54-domain-containing protein [Pyronema domesticum]CCX04250.1 Similar to Nucleoporin nup44; acc. no. O42963 [Pyronema omphalodes CBS 100304]